MRRTLLVSVWVILLGSGVAAAQEEMKGWYFGVGGGTSSVEVSVDGQDDGSGNRTATFEDSTTIWRLYGGYRLTKNFAVEGSLLDYGEFSDTENLPDAIAQYDASLSGWDLNVRGILPLAKRRVDLYLKAGVTRVEVRGEVIFDDTGLPGTPAPVNETEKSAAFLFGGGVQINLLEQRSLGLRLEYYVLNSKLDIESWDALTLNVQYRF